MSRNSPAQNIYDTDGFFNNYSKLPRMTEGLAGASEWPQLQRMLPPVAGRRVLDLGCGDGILSMWAASNGAARVYAFDISKNMLQRAQDHAHAMFANLRGFQPPIFGRMDLENVNLDGLEGPVDLVVSGLALHYVANFEALLAKVYAAMAPGASFVFSIEHPMYTAPIVPGFRSEGKLGAADERGQQSEDDATTPVSDATTPISDATTPVSAAKVFWPVDSYFAEGQRQVRWLEGGVQKQHRTMATYFNMLVAAGFVVRDMAEWGSTADARRKHPDWPENVCPRFLLLAAQKPESAGPRP